MTPKATTQFPPLVELHRKLRCSMLSPGDPTRLSHMPAAAESAALALRQSAGPFSRNRPGKTHIRCHA